MTTKRRKIQPKGKEDPVERQRREIRELKQTIARKKQIPERLFEHLEIRTKEELVEVLKTMMGYQDATSIMHFRQDYLGKIRGVQLWVGILEKDQTPDKKEEDKKALLWFLKNDFKTYREYWDDLIKTYNAEQEALYRSHNVTKPKKIDPRVVTLFVLNPNKPDDEMVLQRIGQKIKAVYAMPHILDDLSLIKRLIEEAYALYKVQV